MTLHVVVTGASSGIGAGIALEYARRGATVALVARRRDRLDAVADACRAAGAPDVRVLAGDVTRRDDVARAVAELDRAWPRVDRAVLNAGGAAGQGRNFVECCAGPALELSADEAEGVMRLNYLGTLYWLAPILAKMRRQGGGRIAVTGSMAADLALPRSGAYTASKAAVRGLIEGLRLDAASAGVSLCLLEPGFIESEMTDGAPWRKPFLQSTERAAEVFVRGIESGAEVVRFPRAMSLVNRAAALVPRRVRRKFWSIVLESR